MSEPDDTLASERKAALHALVWIALFALAIRGWTFGNPLLDSGQQYALFGGQQLLAGHLPYDAFWDRKPFGLFALYALPNLTPWPVVAYQVMAWLAVSLTGWTLYRMARRLTGHGAALAGAFAYAAWLPLFGGIGGQAPVFYNLAMVLAASLTLTQIARDDDARLTRSGAAIMLLCGLALQIKYAAVFEGMFFGLSLLWFGRSEGRTLARMAGDALVWIAAALLPTFAVWLFYLSQGLGALFVQANFLSVLSDEVQVLPALTRLFWQMFGLIPFWLCGWIAWRRWRARGQQGRREALWMLWWAGAALAGFLVFGNWFDHYVLPLLAPLALIAALGIDAARWRKSLIAFVVVIGLAAGIARAIVDRNDRGTRAEEQALVALVQQHVGSGCLYVTEDLPILYYETSACLPTRYVFGEHLLLKRFSHALGVSQFGELRAMLMRRPGVIVSHYDPDSDYDPAGYKLLVGELARSYHLVGSARTGDKGFLVYALNRR